MRISRAVTRREIPGATSSRRATTRSPSASRAASSQVPSASRYGTYCAATLITCPPSGASDGSTSEGIVASSTRASGTRPYLEASKARSRSSIEVAPTRIRPRRRRAASSRPPAAGKSGRPDRPRFTRATRPGCRMLPARHRRFGPSSRGGRSPSSVRFGSRADATIGASISSPDARATPVTRPSRVVTSTTSAPVRISAPKPRAAAASASASAPGPPLAKTVWPAAPPSLPAESASSAAVVPIDRAPSAVNAMARIAIAARTGSLSNDSPTKSAMAIGRTRSSWRASSFESCLKARPSRSPVIASPRPAPLVAGGVASFSEAMNAASARTCRSNPTHAAASAADHARSSSAVRAASAHRVTARPFGWGAKARTSGATRVSPWPRRPSSRATDGRRRPTVWKSPGARFPSASVRVSTVPPSVARRSSTSVRSPAFAR